MTDSRDLERLREWQETRLKREALVKRISDLIERASEKRREGQDTSRDWGAFVEQMQESLREAQQDLIDAVKMEDRIRRRMDRKTLAVHEDEADVSPEHHPFPPIAAEIEAENRQALAARTLHDAPLDLLHEITLEHVGLARGYLAEKAAQGSLNARDTRIAARTELAAQLHETTPPPRTSDRTRKQDALRKAITKAEQSNLNQLTLEEIDLLIHCYGIVKSKLSPSAADRRLLGVLSEALEQVDAVCGSLRSRLFDLL